MNKIGFKNFRRFSEFWPVSYSGVTFLVGRNNSGKSTLVKALLLIVDYLKTGDVASFSFNQHNVEDANVSTYGRAKSKFAEDDYISFIFSRVPFTFRIVVSGNPDSTTVNTIEFEIQDSKTGVIFLITPVQSSISISNSITYELKDLSEDHIILQQLTEQEKEISAELKKIKLKTSPDYIRINAELSNTKKKIKAARASIKREQTQGVFRLQAYYKSANLSEILSEAIAEFSAEWDVQYHEVQKGKQPKSNFEALKAFKDSKYTIERTIDELLLFSKQIENVYLGASLSKQSALFSIRDKSNALAQAIHEFKQLGIDRYPDQPAYQFIINWMGHDKFGLGDAFQITMHAGEAYEMLVETDGVAIHLADKGMGSIQLMLLLVRLSTVIHKKQNNEKSYTVIIEEPELNLHPGFQSKLAALFHSVNLEFGIDFIVETHSEYLIRKTQVIVNEKEYAKEGRHNPFTVIYFDSDATQWRMNYRQDGRFMEEFGTGFFDETRNLVKKII